jgi:hypothetical protein
LEPVEEGDGPAIWEAKDVPYDHTKLGTHVKQGGGMQAFSMRKPKKWQKDQGLVGE